MRFEFWVQEESECVPVNTQEPIMAIPTFSSNASMRLRRTSVHIHGSLICGTCAWYRPSDVML